MTLVYRGFSIPLKEPFQGVRERRGVMVGGPFGWGEFSPFPGFRPEASERCLSAAKDAAMNPWPAPLRTRIEASVVVPDLDPQAAHRFVVESPCKSAKVKVRSEADEDVVEAVRDALGSDGGLRLDANGAWDVDTAVRMLSRFSRYDPEFVEQPVSTLEEMAEVRRRVEVPIAADESLTNMDDARALRQMQAADVVVLKVQYLGGVYAALLIAEACDVPAVVSSPIETSIGVSAGLALAAALPELVYATGSTGNLLLQCDPCAPSISPDADGFIEVTRATIDEKLFEGVMADYELEAIDRRNISTALPNTPGR